MALTSDYATAYGNNNLGNIAKQPKNPNPVDAIGNAHESVARLINRLSALADRLVGSTPTAVGQDVREHSAAVFSDLMERADSIASLASDGMDAINRIERLLP